MWYFIAWLSFNGFIAFLTWTMNPIPYQTWKEPVKFHLMFNVGIALAILTVYSIGQAFVF